MNVSVICFLHEVLFGCMENFSVYFSIILKSRFVNT